MIMESPLQDGTLGGEAGAQAAGAEAAGAVERLDGVGQAALAPGQAGRQHRAGAVVVGQPAQGGGRGRGLVDGQAERGQPPGRGVERGQRRGSVPRAPQRRRPSVGSGEPEPPAQRRGQYSLGQDHGPDRVGGRVPPGNRGREREQRGATRACRGGGAPAGAGRTSSRQILSVQVNGKDAMRAPITHVLGARPNFMKAAPVIAALAELGHEQRIVHTGQHYDERMSEVFFVQLGLPRPDVNLGVGSGSHARQTAEIMTGMEREFGENSPALAVVYGDVNSTLGAALAGAKLGVPLAHVEAGLRSFDDTMPEEINRRLTDQLCALLFATSPEAIGYLAREGRPVSAVHLVGNPMIDTLLAHLDRFDVAAARAAAGLPERYVVATLHRPSNVDDPQAAAALVQALHEVADELDLIIPVHPRGRAALQAAGLGAHPRLHVCDPLGYLEFMALVKGAGAVITDSGGVQEETTLLRVPCLTLRPNTERPITITSGSNRLVTYAELAAAVLKACHDGPYAGELPPLWDGQAGPRIARIITAWLDPEGRP